MSKTLISLLLFVFFFTLTSVSPIFAGGFNVELTAQNQGVVNAKGVGVEVYTGTKDRITAFNIGYEFRLSFQNPTAGQKCIMDKPTSDGKGLAHGTCYSDVSGVFEVYPEVHNFVSSEEWSSLRDTARTSIQFEGTVSSSPAQNTQQLEKQVETLQKIVEQQETVLASTGAKTEALENRLQTQEEDVSTLKRIVGKIVDMLSAIWPF